MLEIDEVSDGERISQSHWLIAKIVQIQLVIIDSFSDLEAISRIVDARLDN